MALGTCSGAPVLRMRAHFPQRGAWWSLVDLDTATAPSGKVQIEFDDGFTLTGTVKQPSGVFLDAARLRVVGGAGGLETMTSAASFANALLSDPLNALLSAAGEALSATVDASITSVFLASWTVTKTYVSRAIDELCTAARAALGKSIGWRVLSDGTIWLGEETWPAQSMPDGAQLLEQLPSEGRFVIGSASPFLLPGVNLDGVGNVLAVDHYVTPDSVRADAWS